MVVDKHRIFALVDDVEALQEYLSGLSNAQFRMVQSVLALEVMPAMQDSGQFWRLFVTLYKKDSRAWLGTLLKALTLRLKPSETSCNHLEPSETAPSASAFAEAVECLGGLSGEFTDIDRQKIIGAVLPLAQNPEQGRALLRACRLTEASEWIPYLLPARSMVSGFLLLGALRYVEHDRALLFRTCRYLMKRGDSLGFSLASIIRLSYDIKEVRGTFSLHLAPYEIARIEQTFEAFSKAVRL